MIKTCPKCQGSVPIAISPFRHCQSWAPVVGCPYCGYHYDVITGDYYSPDLSMPPATPPNYQMLRRGVQT